MITTRIADIAKYEGRTVHLEGWLLMVTPVELSTDSSSNLSLGSGGMAGISTAFAFWVD